MARRIPITIPAIAPPDIPDEEDDWDATADSVTVDVAAAAVAVDASVATDESAETGDEVATIGLPRIAVAVSLADALGTMVVAAVLAISALEICSASESVVGVALGAALGVVSGGAMVV